MLATNNPCFYPSHSGGGGKGGGTKLLIGFFVLCERPFVRKTLDGISMCFYESPHPLPPLSQLSRNP